MLLITKQTNVPESFMGVLYRNLSKGVPIYDSFHHTRNHLFEKHRDDPRMWSAFVLIE